MRFSSKMRRGQVLAAAIAGMGLICAADSARAVNITLVYDAANSLEPSYDPAGAQLTVLMNHIASFYEDAFEDAHNVTVNFRWADLGPGIGGLHTLQSQSGGRENTMLVQLNSFNGATEVAWYMDPTPANDSEYAMTQTLFRDLTPTQRTNFYNAGANIPSTFEVGFQGNALASAPASAQNNPDGLSVMFQEVGHGLGMSAGNTTTVTETADDDYDFDSVNVFGRTLAADTRSGTDIAHVADTFAVMFGSAGSGQRTRPGHTDLFAMAAVHNYLALDIPRREYYGGTNWNADANWTGNTVPSTADEAFIRAAGPAGEARTAGLTAAGFVGTLTVSEGGNFQTNAFNLTAFNAIIIDGFNTDFFVEAGGTLTMSTATLTVQNQGELNMSGGVVNAGTLNNTAEVVGDGIINVSGRFNNSGSLNVVTGTMTINATGTASINLDGSSTGTILFSEPGDVIVTAATSDLVINGLLTDDFNGAMTIGNANSVTMNNPWVLGGNTGTIVFTADGVLNLNGGTTSLTGAVLNGALVTVEGDINVGASGFGVINAPTTFVPGATVVVNTGATLELNNTTTYQGGSHTGAGLLRWDDNVIISGDTTIAVAQLDFDGFLPLATVTVNNAVTLTIDSLITDPPSGTINNSGTMNVNGGAWSNDGTIILSTGAIGGASQFTNGAGARLTVNAGASFITAPSVFNATSDNVLNGTLRLQGNSTIAGGSWSGIGTLSLDDQSTTFTGNTTLGMANFNMDGLIIGTGSVNINSGVTVIVSGAITDVFDSTLNINSGSLTVNGGAWSSSGDVNLAGTTPGVAAAITGQPFTNNSSGVINITGGTNSPGVAAGDDGSAGGPEGGTGGGVISTGTFVNSGNINVGTNSLGRITGNITFNASSDVIINTGGELSLQGPTTYNGGNYTGAGVLTQDTGAMTVAANTTIGVATYDWDGGDTGTFSTTTVNPGVTFTINSSAIDDDGDGVNDPYESTATVASGVLVVNTAAPWGMAGTLSLINTGAGVPTLAGQEMILRGQINSTGAAQITAGLINGGGTVNTNAGSTLVDTGAFRTTAANTLTKIGPGTWNVQGAQSHVAGAQLNIDNGNVQFSQDAGAGGANLTVIHSGTALLLNQSQHLARLIIDTGATATMIGAGNDNVLRMSTFGITGGAVPTGTLNLADENMIVDYDAASPLAILTAQVASGRNGGNWLGAGIRSSTAAANPGTLALGIVEAAAIIPPALFAGESVDATTILLRLTLLGDANLDRAVNLDDFTRLAAAFGMPGSVWSSGDFNYDGFTNLDDFTALAANFGLNVPADLPRGSAVPEPSLGLLMFGAALLGRRNRATHAASASVASAAGPSSCRSVSV